LFWHESVEVNLIEKNFRYIDVSTRVSTVDPWFRVTFVYGEPRTENRHVMWEALRRLHPQSALPWLVVGDFNEAMWGFEHLSARERPERQMLLFREALSDCGLEDIGFVGVPFTYDNGREGAANVKVRLDRAVADSSWRDLFADATLRHLVSPRSDHCPLLLEIRKEAWSSHGPRTFCYEIMWERLESLAQEIKEAWCTAPNREGLGGVVTTLHRVQGALRVWSKKNFGSVSKEIEVKIRGGAAGPCC
jgi:hypothetical protein